MTEAREFGIFVKFLSVSRPQKVILKTFFIAPLPEFQSDPRDLGEGSGVLSSHKLPRQV